jgi:lipoteichoic acid synthase
MSKALHDRAQANSGPPFFWAAYNHGSHAFLDVPEGGHRYGDGSNSALNRFHELDTSISRFLAAFEASAFAKDTLLIITSDHSSYPEPPVVEAFADATLSPYFIDRIPLMIRVPGVKKGMRFENGIHTSLDLAPTVLHLMGIDDAEHAFLGESIFAVQPAKKQRWAAIGSEFYRINSAGVEIITAKTETEDDQAAIDEILYYYHLESENRVFKPN